MLNSQLSSSQSLISSGLLQPATSSRHRSACRIQCKYFKQCTGAVVGKRPNMGIVLIALWNLLINSCMLFVD